MYRIEINPFFSNHFLINETVSEQIEQIKKHL